MQIFYIKLYLYYQLFYYSFYHVSCSVQPEATMVDDAKSSENRPCASSEFRCHKGGCISLQWHCDSDIDCKDGSDELDCDKVPMDHVKCPPGKYRCRNGRCIAEAYHCDGDNDCGDWSDEDKCEGKVECQRGELRCDDGGCINFDWKCDGDKDCDDGSDEKDCHYIHAAGGVKSCNPRGIPRKPNECESGTTFGDQQLVQACLDEFRADNAAFTKCYQDIGKHDKAYCDRVAKYCASEGA